MTEFCQAPPRGPEPSSGEFSEPIKKGRDPRGTRTQPRPKKSGARLATAWPVLSGETGPEQVAVAPLPSTDRTPSDGPSHPGRTPAVGGSSGEVSTLVSSPHAREVRVLAIDIGAHGAAALLDGAGDLLDVVDLPTLAAGPACRPEISPHLFAAIVRRWDPARAWVEHIGPRAGDRPAGAFAFGGSKATVETALAVLGVPFRTITPATWKRAAGIPPGRDMKDLARARAIERWPGHAELFGRVKDHDRAEAALIGWAGLQREGQGR